MIGPDGTPDRSVRPNQVFAASLPHALLTRPQAKAMLNLVTRHLVTPFGLRTLAPSDPRYLGRYAGDPRARDSAYHQGTAWPWLLGPYADALLYAEGGTVGVRRKVRELLRPVVGLLESGCLGQVPELADGDAPHAANGCPAQAWSVAEVLRVWLRVREPKRTPTRVSKSR